MSPTTASPPSNQPWPFESPDGLTPQQVEARAVHYTQLEGRPSENLGWDELACRGTDKVFVDRELAEKFQRLRDAMGVPLVVTSGYRSVAYNEREGGKPRSRHLFGRAIDIVTLNVDPHELEEKALEVGFLGIGRYPSRGFMHLDLGPRREWGREFPHRKTRFEPPELDRDVADVAGATGKATAGGAGTVGAVVAAKEATGVEVSTEHLDIFERLAGWGAGMLAAAVALYAVWRLRHRIWARWEWIKGRFT